MTENKLNTAQPNLQQSDRLEARHPDAQIWIVRIGSRHVRRFGGRTRRPA